MKPIVKLLSLAVFSLSIVQAAPVLQDFAINVNGVFTDGDFTVAGIDATLFNQTTGLGTLTFNYSPGAAGTYFVDFFFDHSLHLTFYNEYGAIGGSAPAGTTYQIDNSFSDANRTGTIFANAQNNALDNTNHVPGSTSNFTNSCGANGGGAVNASCNNDVAMAIGFSFTLAAGDAETITVSVTSTNPGGFYLEQLDPDSPSQIFLTGNAVGGTPVTGIPEPADWSLALTGLFGLLALRTKRAAKLRRRLTGPIAVAALALTPSLTLAVAPTVKTVPVDPTNPASTHDVISGVPAILGGTSDQFGATFTYDWDPGDGGSHCSGSVTTTNHYALQCTHTYVAAVATNFTATLKVTNSATSEQGSANYLVTVRADNLTSRVNIAIDNGLWYMHTQLVRGTDAATGTPTGTWTTCSGFSCTSYQCVDGSNIQAFEVNNHLQNGPASDPYTEDVARVLAQIFTYLTTFTVTPTYTVTYQSNPLVIDDDGNNNGYAVQNNQYPQHYQDGQLMDAIVASGTPSATAPTGPVAAGANPGIRGRMFLSIVQDMEDAYVACQDKGTSEGGGWYYSCNVNQGDNSASQWAAIGMIAAERGTGFGVTVDPNAKKWNTHWLGYSQQANGQFGYQSSSPAWGPFATTPSGLVQLAWDGIGRGDPRWDRAETVYRDSFGSASTDPTINPKEYFYGMFSFTKAMLLHNPGGVLAPITLLQSQTPGVNPIDWYAAQTAAFGGTDTTNGIARTLVGYQNAAGYWYGNSYSSAQYPLETGWGVIMLRRTVFTGVCSKVNGRGTPATKLQPARVDLTWSDLAGAANYQLLRGTVNGGPYSALATVNTTAYSDKTGLASGGTYYYVVQPLNSTGSAACQSDPAQVTIPAGR